MSKFLDTSIERRHVLLSVAGLVLTSGCAAPVAAQRPTPSGSTTTSGPASDSAMPPLLKGEGHLTPLPEPRSAEGAAANPPNPQHYVHAGPKAIALTIDDGPDPQFTPQVLDILQRHHIKATFFLIGSRVKADPGLVRETIARGHRVANHSWSHPDLSRMQPAAIHDELVRTTAAIHAAGHGYKPKIFRAPYGSWSPDVLKACKQLKLRPMDWSVDPRDWSRPGTPQIVDIVMRDTRTGSIILEHDGGGDRSQTVAALDIFIPRLLAKGYRFVFP